MHALPSVPPAGCGQRPRPSLYVHLLGGTFCPVHVLAAQDGADGHEDDLEVKPEGQVLDVDDVVAELFLGEDGVAVQGLVVAGDARPHGSLRVRHD